MPTMNSLHLISFLVFSSKYFLLPTCSANPFSKTRQDFPRLCAYVEDPNQYYPCVLNYIGLNSWSLYRCPNHSTFDEQTQQCLLKIPISDTFEQLATSPSISNVQFYRLASFILHRSASNEDHELHQRRLVSLPPIFDQFIDSLTKKTSSEMRKKRDLADPSSNGVIWSHGFPLMRLDSRPVGEQIPMINSRTLQFPSANHHPVAVSEDELKYKKICYFTNWSQYRLGPARFEPENIDPFLCTHITYAFASINNDTLLINPIEDNDFDLYQRINTLKVRNPQLKTLLGVGGWNMKSFAFSKMIHDENKRRSFIFDTINYLHRHHFDGLEIDWEYPGIRGGQPDDRHYLTLLIQEFKQATNAQSIITGKPRLILAAAVAAEQQIVTNGYEIEEIAKILDYINVMTYDFHGSWQNATGLNAPLYRRFDELDRDATLNQDYGIGVWLKNGAPAHKLVLGLPLFARSFLLARSEQNNLHSPTVGNGTEGPFTRTPGFVSNFEVCLFQTDPKWQRRTVPDGSESEYMFKDRDWIAYETLENVRKRAAYVVANHLGGMFVWSLDMDDFSGAFCHNGTYPYIKHSLALLPNQLSSYLK